MQIMCTLSLYVYVYAYRVVEYTPKYIYSFTKLNTIHIRFVFILVWFSFQHTHCDGSHSLNEQNRDRYMEITMARARESEGWREGLWLSVFIYYYYYMCMLCVSSSAICRRISFHQRFSNGRLLRLSYPICGSFLVWFCLFVFLTVFCSHSLTHRCDSHFLPHTNTHTFAHFFKHTCNRLHVHHLNKNQFTSTPFRLLQ